MNILYIGYWGANEGLSQSTVIPHLKILLGFDIERLVYISLERNEESSFGIPSNERLTHVHGQGLKTPAS